MSDRPIDLMLEKERGEMTGHCAYLPILPFYAPLRREKLRLSPAALHMWLYGMTITLREQSCSRYSAILPRNEEISIIHAFTLCTLCTEFQSNFLQIWSFPSLPLFPISFLLLFPLWPLGDPSSDMQIGIAKAEGRDAETAHWSMYTEMHRDWGNCNWLTSTVERLYSEDQTSCANDSWKCVNY